MQNRLGRGWVVPVSLILIIGLYYVPPIHSRLAWRLDSLRTQIKYMIHPPDQAVFQPSQQTQINLAVTQMIQTLQATMTPQQSTSAALTPTPQIAGLTLAPTVTTTPLPATIMLQGV